jgi:hypothetical protein
MILANARILTLDRDILHSVQSRIENAAGGSYSNHELVCIYKED